MTVKKTLKVVGLLGVLGIYIAAAYPLGFYVGKKVGDLLIG